MGSHRGHGRRNPGHQKAAHPGWVNHWRGLRQNGESAAEVKARLIRYGFLNHDGNPTVSAYSETIARVYQRGGGAVTLQWSIPRYQRLKRHEEQVKLAVINGDR